MKHIFFYLDSILNNNANSVELHLAESDGVVVGLSSCVEVNSLFNVIMTFVVSGQMVGRCSVACFIGYLRGLKENKGVTS